MNNQIEILNWDITIGGNRKGANISVDHPERTGLNDKRFISGTVTGWLSSDFEPTSRKNAAYCVVSRWSYNVETNGIPREFAVPLGKAPQYYSQTYRPAEILLD